MKNNFDKIIDRAGTNSVKWDLREHLFNEKNILPMWVADMDFENPPAVRRELKNFVKNTIIGYAIPPYEFYEAIMNWQRERHQMELTKENILFSPGVVSSIGVMIQAFSKPGDKVIIHDPVYPPFTNLVKVNHREVVRSALKVEKGQYHMDFNDIEENLQDEKAKLFILSNPHNPGGRVWSKEEMYRLAELCHDNDVILVSDEIHGDLVYPSQEMVSPVTLDERFKQTVVTLTSVTKTFNLAGIKNSMIFVYDEKMIEQIKEIQSQTEQSGVNTFGYVAAQAALSNSQEWHAELLDYLENNRKIVCDFFDRELPEVFYMKPEGTYLFWFDASSLGIKDADLKDIFAKIGKIGLNDGKSYGPNGDQYMRFNFAAPQSMVEDGLERIKKVFDHYQSR
ncbi:MalY/PatB family protein [Lacticigenium naphthae]|uniref:MalY/PatB family protein n=1 Tax=Lacticigenium naphthae TaxID=515351 RepID=UPI00041B5431|nr:MalY/PatB family protein [Lacticigenium naphthae]